MNTLFIGQNFIQANAIPSTNEWAWDLLENSPPEGTVVFTPNQTAGRGQAGTSWVSNPGENLTFSLIIRPTFLNTREIFDLNRITTLSIIRTLATHIPEFSFQIKWPNDILINRKKICGILIRNQFSGNFVRASVIGIGLNVNQIDFPQVISETATSLRLITGSALNVMDLLETLCGELEKSYLELRTGKTDKIRSEFLRNLYRYQERGLFRIDGKETEAMLVGVKDDGMLALEIGGKLSYFAMKEVEFCL